MHYRIYIFPHNQKANNGTNVGSRVPTDRTHDDCSEGRLWLKKSFSPWEQFPSAQAKEWADQKHKLKQAWLMPLSETSQLAILLIIKPSTLPIYLFSCSSLKSYEAAFYYYSLNYLICCLKVFFTNSFRENLTCAMNIFLPKKLCSLHMACRWEHISETVALFRNHFTKDRNWTFSSIQRKRSVR